jgi:hypothetical protein
MEPAAGDAAARTAGEASTSGSSFRPKYLLVFPHRLLDFRLPELEAVAQVAGCKPGEMQLLEPFGGERLSPFWYMTVPSEDIARRIAERAVLLRVSSAGRQAGAWRQLRATPPPLCSGPALAEWPARCAAGGHRAVGRGARHRGGAPGGGGLP